MHFLLQLILAIGLVSAEKLDRTYLPPPGAKFSGGSPGDIQTPLEFPKETYSTTLRPQSFGDRIHPDQSVIGISHGLPTVPQGAGIPSDFGHIVSTSKPAYDLQSSYKLPTTTTSYAFSQTTTHPPVEGLENTVGPFGLVTSGFPTTPFPDFPTTASRLFTVPHSQQGEQVIPGYQSSENIPQPGQVPTLNGNLQYTGSVSPSLMPVGQSNIGLNRPGYSVGQRNQYQQAQQPNVNILPGSNVQVPGSVSQLPNSEVQNSNQYQEFSTRVPNIGQPGYQSTIPTATSPGTTYGNNINTVQGQIVPGRNIPQPNLTIDKQTITGESDLSRPGTQLIQRPGQQQYQGYTEGSFPSGQDLNSGSGKPGFTDGSLQQNIYTPTSTVSSVSQVSDFSSTPGFQTGSSTLPDGSLFSETPTGINRGIIPTASVNRPERPQAESDRNAIILNYDNTLTPEGEFAYSFDTSNGIHAEENGTSVDGVKAKGGYSYIGDDGKLYSIVYSADENGFQPHGDHLPTPPPVPEAIQKVIEQAYRNKEAGIIDDGTYDEDKYGHNKYQGIMNRPYRPYGMNKNINKVGNVENLDINRYKDDGEITSIESEDKYSPSAEEFSEDSKAVNVGDRRRPGSMTSSRRPVTHLTAEKGDVGNQQVYENLPENEYNHRRPIDTIPQRRPANRIPENSKIENYQDNNFNTNKKYPTGEVPSRPSYTKQPIDIDTSDYKEDFVDNANSQIDVGNMPLGRPSNQQYGNQNYNNERRPMTEIPSRQPDSRFMKMLNVNDRVNENSGPDYTKQGQSRPIETGRIRTQMSNKVYPDSVRYPLNRPKSDKYAASQAEDILENVEQTEDFGDITTDVPIVRGRLPSKVPSAEYSDSGDNVDKSVSQSRLPYRQESITTRPETSKRPGLYSRYNQTTVSPQTSSTYTPEPTRYNKFDENYTTRSPITQNGKHTIFQQQPIVTNLPSSQKETGYQYLPPQKKFEQTASKSPLQLQEVTKTPSNYYGNKDGEINIKPFTTPSVSRDEIQDNDYDHYPEEEEDHGSSVITKPNFKPILNQNQQTSFTQQKYQNLNKNNGPEYNGQEGTPYRDDGNRDTQNIYSGQTNIQAGTSRRPSYQGTQTTSRPQQFRPTVNVETVQDIRKQRPGQDNYFVEKYADKPKDSFGLTPSTASTPIQNTFIKMTSAGIQRPGQNIQVNDAESSKRPGQQEYGFTTKMPSQYYYTTEGNKNIPSISQKTTYRPLGTTASEIDNYSNTSDFGTTLKPASKLPGRFSTPQGQLPSTTYRPPFTFTEGVNEQVDDITPGSNKVNQYNQGIESTSTYRPNYVGQDIVSSKPVYQSSDDRKTTEYKPGVDRFETPVNFPIKGVPSTAAPYRIRPTTQKVIGEDFSGPKQAQKFDPKYGYYY
ncbi:uncharacterized protein LOC131851433 [Achroia grisella]|uniref:uncharacterized protein LOC131851433 n=1 Tax=Achroia grisella TaxID=688607 RepID=UPI0027D281ED|nr:uncharacterized protein LOC131851433 [Achroia grisella]